MISPEQTISQIRTAIKKKFGRKFITATELCQITEIAYPHLMRDRPESVFRYFSKVGTQWICSSSDAAKIIKSYKEGEK